MRIVVESNTGIRVAELPLRDFGSGVRLKENCGMHVPEGEPGSRLECGENT